MKLVNLLVFFLSIILIRFPLSESSSNNRIKRLLSFAINGGTTKIVLGVIFPVSLGTKQSLVCGVNFQAQYAIPQNPIILYNKLNGRFLKRTKKSSNENENISDTSREYLYNTIEEILNRNGYKGRECLLRAICENAQTNLKHNGLFGEVLDLMLTPGRENINKDYFEANQAGKWGNCSVMYFGCSAGLLDQISIMDL